jgi:hypothetical protein
MEAAPRICFLPTLARPGLLSCRTQSMEKSNAIKAIPERLERLASTGAIVSIDAMGTPTAIAAEIVEQEADDVVAPNGNQTSPSRANA